MQATVMVRCSLLASILTEVLGVVAVLTIGEAAVCYLVVRNDSQC